MKSVLPWDPFLPNFPLKERNGMNLLNHPISGATAEPPTGHDPNSRVSQRLTISCVFFWEPFPFSFTPTWEYQKPQASLLKDPSGNSRNCTLNLHGKAQWIFSELSCANFMYKCPSYINVPPVTETNFYLKFHTNFFGAFAIQFPRKYKLTC